MTEKLNYLQQIQLAADYIQSLLSHREPQIALVLGSGLGDLADQIDDAIIIPYQDVPHFPHSTVQGHAGRFVIESLQGKCVIAMQGRFHYYEGYSMRKVALPIYVIRQLGVHSLIITNAAGGMNPHFQAGDLMLITDHINMTGDNPLIGTNYSELGVRFPDMSQAYDRQYFDLAKLISEGIAGADGTPLIIREGVYCGISGPSYMTPAELKMLAQLGGDAVGMSTVCEVIAARHCGLKVLGVSCITDRAVGDQLAPLSHEQVIATAERTKPIFISFIQQFIAQLK